MTGNQWTALAWEQEHDRCTDDAPQPCSITERAEYRSAVERARDVLRRCHIDPMQSEWAPLVREIGKEIVAAEMAMLRNSLALIRETFGEPRR